MKRLNSIAKISTLAIATSLAASQAVAWEMGAEPDKNYVYTKTDDGASITLMCSDTVGIRATVYLDGNEMDNLAVGTERRLATRQVTIDTEATEPRRDRWVWVRSARTLISTKPWQGRRVYNAVITGSPINMTVRRVGDFTLNLPPVDDNFKSFSKTCL